MEDEIRNEISAIAQEEEGKKEECGPNGCGCGNGSCQHGPLTKHYVNEELSLAFLLALTPLVVLTFFGQVGLL